MSKAELHRRLILSHKATVKPRPCTCSWCTSGPRRTNEHLRAH